MNTEEILKQKYTTQKDAQPAPQVDPATLSGTELLLRAKYLKATIAVSPSGAAVEGVTKQALRVEEEVSEEAVMALKAALELLEARERARKLIELAKKASEGKQ